MRRAALALLVAGACSLPPRTRAPTVTRPVYDAKGRLVQTPFAPSRPRPHLTEERATRIFLRDEKVADWLDRYPERRPRDRRDLRREARGLEGRRLVGLRGRDRDSAGSTTAPAPSPRRGRGRRSRGRWPAATTARSAAGRSTAVGVWLAFCIVFLLGLADLRRPLSLRNLDLARPALVLGLALVLQPRRDLHERAARLPAASVPARDAWSGASGAAGPARRGRSGRSGCSRRPRSS